MINFPGRARDRLRRPSSRRVPVSEPFLDFSRVCHAVNRLAASAYPEKAERWSKRSRSAQRGAPGGLVGLGAARPGRRACEAADPTGGFGGAVLA